jgi:hypothetical protein
MAHDDITNRFRESTALSSKGVPDMTLDERISLASRLIVQREEIDQQLNALFGGSTISKKQPRCSQCGQEGHNAKTCPDKLIGKGEPAEQTQ